MKALDLRSFVIVLIALACFLPFVSASAALVLGVIVAMTIGNPYIGMTRKVTKYMLSYSIIGLGAGMNLSVVLQAGLSGLGYTAATIAFALLVGFILGFILRTEKDVSWLIAGGTAICGGSAIAALAPAIHAKDHNISVALGVVFLLNAAALLLFPWLGHMLDLSQHQFGLWSALAIHDTSSVVGAGLVYGPEALETATTVKLARALWIVPVVLAVQAVYQFQSNAGDRVNAGAYDGAGQGQGQGQEQGKTQGEDTNVIILDGQGVPVVKPKQKLQFPWFILGFLLMAALVSYVPVLEKSGRIVADVARQVLVVCLFLIGTNLTRRTLRTVGIRPLLQGVFLWLIMAALTLGCVYFGFIA